MEKLNFMTLQNCGEDEWQGVRYIKAMKAVSGNGYAGVTPVVVVEMASFERMKKMIEAAQANSQTPEPDIDKLRDLCRRAPVMAEDPIIEDIMGRLAGKMREAAGLIDELAAAREAWPRVTLDSGVLIGEICPKAKGVKFDE